MKIRANLQGPTVFKQIHCLNVCQFQAYPWTCLLIKTEPLWGGHFPRSLPLTPSVLGTKPLPQVPLQNILVPSHKTAFSILDIDLATLRGFRFHRTVCCPVSHLPWSKEWIKCWLSQVFPNYWRKNTAACQQSREVNRSVIRSY